MNAIQEAIDVLDDVLSWAETPGHILRSANKALTELRGIEAVDVDELAQFIRRIDGDNTMGAGELAERISDHLHANGYLPNQWQDISTAPRDGSNILAWNHNDLFEVQPYIAWWGQDDNTPDDDESREEWLTGEGDDWSTGSYYTPCKPTHWMPIPKPPKNTHD